MFWQIEFNESIYAQNNTEINISVENLLVILHFHSECYGDLHSAVKISVKACKSFMKVWNMFKVNKKDTRAMPMASFWCFYY